MKKISSIHYGGKLLGIGLVTTVIVPLTFKMITGTFPWWSLLPGGITLTVWLILFIIETHQDFGKVPHYEKHLSDDIPFDSAHQDAITSYYVREGFILLPQKWLKPLKIKQLWLEG